MSCEFERPIISDLSFVVQAGQLLHIQGANGSGKTSLLRCILGLFPLTQGSVYWYRTPLSAAKMVIGENVFFQAYELALKLDLSPRENLQVWLRSAANPHQNNSDVEHLESVIRQTLDAMDLLMLADKPSRLLSSGQQRRLALSKLQLSGARVWVLDEPFSTLDTRGVELLQALLNQHVHAGGSVILTSHQTLTLDVPITNLHLSAEI